MTHPSETPPDPRIAAVGHRVRRARNRRGITRQKLSQLSGVSPRYLAQLESGSGNISIALLHRIADALDYRIEWLVAADDPWTSPVVKAAELFRDADMATRARVMQQLAPQGQEPAQASRLTLIGLRGAGKSTLGRAVASALDMPFAELNKEIERLGGMPVGEIIALYGAEGYRKLEAEALDLVTRTHQHLVLAVAGGIVGEPETFAHLLNTTHTIWVRATPQDHMDRVRAQGDERPMAGNPEAMQQLRALLASREPLYARAEAQLNTSGSTVAQSLKALLALIEGNGFLQA